MTRAPCTNEDENALGPIPTHDSLYCSLLILIDLGRIFVRITFIANEELQVQLVEEPLAIFMLTKLKNEAELIAMNSPEIAWHH